MFESSVKMPTEVNPFVRLSEGCVDLVTHLDMENLAYSPNGGHQFGRFKFGHVRLTFRLIYGSRSSDQFGPKWSDHYANSHNNRQR